MAATGREGARAGAGGAPPSAVPASASELLSAPFAALGAYARPAKLFLAGGGAGAVARTCTAPLDRIKLLMQVQALGQGGAKAGQYTGVGQALVKIAKEEGILAYWKGNGVNIIRIFPYSAAQLAANDQYKAYLADAEGNLTTPRRLLAGAMAGMTGTALTHPLDTVRLRLAMPNSGYKGPIDAARSMIAKEGAMSMYKGIFPTLVGVAPYTALNFYSFDTLNNKIAEAGVPPGVVTKLLVGAVAGTMATTVCYPLDTVRRRMQMAGNTYSSMGNALTTIASKEGIINGFYQGWWANTVKVVPQNAIRLVMYGLLKDLLQIEKEKTDT